jgi:hypothetical protein
VVAAMALGCATPSVMLDRAMVVNATDGMVRAVSVLHEGTLETGAINAILPGRTFELGFTGEPVRAQRAIVRWLDNGGVLNKRVVDLPTAPVRDGQLMRLVYTLHTDGNVSAALIPAPGL